MAACPQTTDLSDAAYFGKFMENVTSRRVPLYGGLDLTHRCNLKCLHCYVAGDNSGPEDYDDADS